VEARINRSCPCEHYGLAEPARQHVYVGEVPCGSPVKECEQLVAREFFRASVGPAGVAEAGRSGGAVTARSTTIAASALRMAWEPGRMCRFRGSGAYSSLAGGPPFPGRHAR